MNLIRKKIQLVIIRNPMDVSFDSVEVINGHDLQVMLKQAFPLGITSSIEFYHQNLFNKVFVSRETKKHVDDFLSLNGRIYAVIMPKDPFTIAIAAFVVSMVATVALLMTMPIPQPTGGNPAPSPNNALAQRTNRQRIGGRICDIFGELWSIPDLIATPYTLFINSDEVEFAFMCIGAGKFEVKQAKDDTTPVEQVRGMNVAIYNPNTNALNQPSKQFGNYLTDVEWDFSRQIAKKYTSVNGQILPSPDNYITAEDLSAMAGGVITSQDINFTWQFVIGGELTISGAGELASGNNLMTTETPSTAVKYNLNGSYTVKAIDGNTITLESPQLIAPDWDKLTLDQDFTKGEFDISTNSNSLWQGYFYTDDSEYTHICINLFSQALYLMSKNGNRWQPISISFIVEIETLNDDDTVYSASSHKIYIASRNDQKYKNGDFYSYTSDDTVRQSTGQSYFFSVFKPHPKARSRFRIRRKSNTLRYNGQQVVQEVKLRDFYTMRKMDNAIAETKNNTFVYVKTVATEGALAVKDRKLRLLVQRYVMDWRNSDNLILSKRADDIIYHIARQQSLGNLPASALNMPQISAEIDKNIGLFGTPLTAEFSYSFDDKKTSAEEMIQAVAQAVFCQAIRMNNKIELLFEQATPFSTAIFNSHNILPNTFTMNGSFGIVGDYDGVSIDYINPKYDAQLTLNTSENLANAKKIKVIGVRNKTQAYFHMMRNWNKLRYTTKTCDFTGGDETNIVTRSNRIAVADQSNAKTSQGIVKDIVTMGENLMLLTSNIVNIPLNEQGVIFVQTVNNGVDAIPCEKYSDYAVKITRLPNGAVSFGYKNVVNPSYQIVTNLDLRNF